MLLSCTFANANIPAPKRHTGTGYPSNYHSESSLQSSMSRGLQLSHRKNFKLQCPTHVTHQCPIDTYVFIMDLSLAALSLSLCFRSPHPFLYTFSIWLLSHSPMYKAWAFTLEIDGRTTVTLSAFSPSSAQSPSSHLISSHLDQQLVTFRTRITFLATSMQAFNPKVDVSAVSDTVAALQNVLARSQVIEYQFRSGYIKPFIDNDQTSDLGTPYSRASHINHTIQPRNLPRGFSSTIWRLPTEILSYKTSTCYPHFNSILHGHAPPTGSADRRLSCTQGAHYPLCFLLYTSSS
ncbi:hypothetical protein DFJ58DRAFT_39886 [Suillus subalutaceus]|uniref:uncharacterized protein n=1 Tax=Suillus subalutaceus TaxID=48586 RepID=UPI001B877256|nr:uncharacterized protein DFJ58DRAFT_39886 [Suillus subalutaceus]KAG1870095.1 hypothetical protein DFJ58DRAFT_39886 [Suillus subalutaceus]